MAILRCRKNREISSFQADMVVTGVQADLTMVQDYVDQQYKIIHVRPIKSPLSCLSKLLNNDAIALWIRHRPLFLQTPNYHKWNS